METPTPRDSHYFLYGKHAVVAALENPNRIIDYVAAIPAVAEAIQPAVEKRGVSLRLMDKDKLGGLLKAGGDHKAVHQGVAIRVKKLKPPPLVQFLNTISEADTATIIIADRVSDTQNVGAILRNLRSFGGTALLLPSRHAPSENASLAKAAAGALESVPLLYEANLSQSLKLLKKYGFWCYGLDATAKAPLHKTQFAALSAIVLGSEGEGIRPLVLKNCDEVIAIPMAQPHSLNVAATSAITLYHRANNQ